MQSSAYTDFLKDDFKKVTFIPFESNYQCKYGQCKSKSKKAESTLGSISSEAYVCDHDTKREGGRATVTHMINYE